MDAHLVTYRRRGWGSETSAVLRLAAIDKVRSTSKTVTVEKDTLAKLLIDHSKLLLRHKIEG